MIKPTLPIIVGVLKSVLVLKESVPSRVQSYLDIRLSQHMKNLRYEENPSILSLQDTKQV